MFASRNGSEDLVRYVLGHGADLRLADVSGQNALFYAARNPDRRVAALLQQRSR